MSICLTKDFERDQSSELYRNMDEISATNIRILTASDILYEHSACLLVLNAAHASCFLRFMSLVFPSSDPRNLQSLQLVSPLRLTL